jgi:lipopolysaccharide/colanic/teichoic acid biosynthesis glycosyltransferase
MIASTQDEATAMLTNLDSPEESRPSPYDNVKRVLDLTISLILLVVASPLILILMLSVWTGSKGSPLYSQRRLGHRGKTITIYKIRTMYQDSERDSGPVWSGRGDPRVTPIGRLLRASHVDELPQLINILRGEMSLIGPRPERPEIAARLEKIFPGYGDRLRTRPGLTGLAQVLQGPDVDLQSVNLKLGYDLFYLENAGFSLDIRICVATVLHVLHVPAPWIARICILPLGEAAVGDEPSVPLGERIALTSQAHPFTVN